MRFSIILIVAVCLGLTVHAIRCESIKAQHAYEWGIPTDTDDVDTLFKKAAWCMTYEDRTIKWRRGFMIAFVCAMLLHLLQQRVPTVKEFVLQFSVIYIGYSIMWYSYVGDVVNKSVALGKQCLRRVRRRVSA